MSTSFSDCVTYGARAAVIQALSGDFSWDNFTHEYMAECYSRQPLISWCLARDYVAQVVSGSNCPDHPLDGETWIISPVWPLTSTPAETDPHEAEQE